MGQHCRRALDLARNGIIAGLSFAYPAEAAESCPQSFASPVETKYELNNNVFVSITMPHTTREATQCFHSIYRTVKCSARQPNIIRGRRWIQISTTPSGASPQIDNFSSETTTSIDVESPGMATCSRHNGVDSSLDAKFEVLGAPYSLLSASLSASQNLYTRRGTLVGVSGKAENVRIILIDKLPWH